MKCPVLCAAAGAGAQPSRVPALAALLAGLLWAAAAAIGWAQPQPSPSIRWITNSNPSGVYAVEIAGLEAARLAGLAAARWSPSEWGRLFAVFAGQGDWRNDLDIPPVLGRYEVADQVVRFTPAYPAEPGVVYRAVLRLERLPGAETDRSGVITSAWRAPARREATPALVRQVYPSANVVPENLLKFYVAFSQPMQRGNIYEYIRLEEDSGRPIELPFLEIDEELWNPEMTRVTLFIDPGRIKRGVRPLEEIGPSLEAGRVYALKIDAAWKDANGTPLRAPFVKRFRVIEPDRTPPAPSSWRLNPPAAGTRASLTVAFPEPMDHALVTRLLGVTGPDGTPVRGRAGVSNEERVWSFEPEASWRPGGYLLRIPHWIEDLAGNNIGKPFEVDGFSEVERRPAAEISTLPFQIEP